MSAVSLTRLIIIVASIVCLSNECTAASTEQQKTCELSLPFAANVAPDQEWYTLGTTPLRLTIPKFTLPGNKPRVESASLLLYYRYEPDWTDVSLKLVVEGLDGSPMVSTPWYGANHPQKTPHGRWYEFPLPRETVEAWATGKGSPGALVRREYVGGGRNPNHPLVFGSPNGSESVRPVLKLRCSFSGVAAPTPPEWSMQPPPNPVKDKVLLTWEHKAPHDFNQGAQVSYQIETSQDRSNWVPLAQLPGDKRKAFLPMDGVRPGGQVHIRIRAVNDLGAASPWVQTDKPYVQAAPEESALEAYFESPLRKIMRFDLPQRPSSPPTFFAARGESELIQLVLTGAATLDDLRVTISPLQGPGGSAIADDNVCIYRQEYINLTKPSKNVGRIGWWPDALVPLRDAYFGESRAKRPMVKNGGENESFWIEIDVPSNQTPGTYRGTVRVDSGSVLQKEIPLAFTVRNFTIPVQQTLRTSFGCDPTYLGKNYNIYTKEASKHRISLYGGYFTITGVYDVNSDTCSINAKQAEQYYESAMTGKGMPHGRSFDSINVSGKPDVNSDQAWVAYWRAVQAYLESKGWLDRTYVYVWDEPRDSDIPELARRARLIKAGAPKLRTLVTTECRPELRGLIDIWCPVINFYDSKDKHGGEELYRSRQKSGEQVWWYTSMMSEETKSLPSYFIDASAVSPRVVGWLTWQRGVQGVLYYHMALAWKNRPWENQFAFDANGDGTLWYPGTPDVIGGTKEIPVPSIRLKAIRDGFEDFEYLALLEKLGGRSEAESICAQVGNGPFAWRDDPDAMAKARALLADAIERRVGGQ
ncbi:hypothetical protein NNJEOMEG_01749 [Fundidesulfovibrio magnetotacticus]|uniref:Fibronectin type-III domain-containing protein n=1 Tax=Fundidesulfovibrio magnetotacticus TaxID=2730080 RepID=A0A6V8LTK5_9BACT|nr:glycoside hydrolase domain-containing protein [Fundidesulfovibrio magnetotacticus]GFK93911.1 hypothetical protein NNJEOMEG_01749 [Fundidesulfovibrio magnetotacticus]